MTDLIKLDAVGIFFQNFEEVFVQVLKYEIKAVASKNRIGQLQPRMLRILIIGLFSKTVNENAGLLFEALMEVHDVLLAQLFEHLDFAHSRFLHDFVVVRLFEFLDRDC